jgi:hypothetical protein
LDFGAALWTSSVEAQCAVLTSLYQRSSATLASARLGLFWLPLSQSYAWPAAVLVDELDAGGFEGAPDDVKRRAPRLA